MKFSYSYRHLAFQEELFFLLKRSEPPPSRVFLFFNFLIPGGWVLTLKWHFGTLSSFQNRTTSDPGLPAVHKDRPPGQTLWVTSSTHLACDNSYKQGFLSFFMQIPASASVWSTGFFSCLDAVFSLCIWRQTGPDKGMSLPLSWVPSKQKSFTRLREVNTGCESEFLKRSDFGGIQL